MFDKINYKKAKYERNLIISYVIIGIAFFLYIPLGASMGPAAFFIIGIPFVGGGLFAAYNQKKIKELSNEFKKIYVTAEMKKIFPESQYFYNSGFSEHEVVESGLLFDRDRFASEDLMIGNFNGVEFRCSDVTQKEVRRSGKHTRVVTVFQGRFYEFDFPKSFKSNLLLLQPYNYRPFSGFQKIKMESVDFNSELKVLAKNELEAFYLLTPHFMERLLYMDRKYFDKISFSFKNKKLFIAIDTRYDYFDIKAFRKVDDSIFTEYKEELNDIKAFIEVLRLDDTLFKKDESYES